MPPHPQPNNTIQNSVPPKQPQLHNQSSPNPNNKHIQLAYNNEARYKNYP